MVVSVSKLFGLVVVIGSSYGVIDRIACASLATQKLLMSETGSC